MTMGDPMEDTRFAVPLMPTALPDISGGAARSTVEITRGWQRPLVAPLKAAPAARARNTAPSSGVIATARTDARMVPNITR